MIPRRLLPVLFLAVIVACRPSFDAGPMQPGDTALAVEPIQSAADPDDGDPPPPPIDTLSQMRAGGVEADLTDLIIRVRYNLDEKGTRGWVDFPKDNQPAGVTIDSTARLVIHGRRIGGIGTIQITGGAGTVDIDLGQVSGTGTVIAGRCKKDERPAGACATITFKEIRWTPKGGESQAVPGSLEVGVPRPGTSQ